MRTKVKEIQGKQKVVIPKPMENINKNNGSDEFESENIKNKNKARVLMVKKQVADFLQMQISDFSGRSRKHEFIKLRYVTTFFVKKMYPSISNEFVGSEIGGFDHSTISHAMKTIQNLIDTDKNFNMDMQKLAQIINLHKGLDLKNISLKDDFFYLDLNDVSVVKFSDKGSIVFNGVPKKDIERFVKEYFHAEPVIDELSNTGAYILQKKQ